MISMGRCVGQTRVEDNQLGAVNLAFNHALCVGVEVVTRLEVRADQKNNFGVRVVGAGPVETHPELIALATAGRADVGVRVVTINPPGGEYAFGEAIFARTADVIHDLLATVFNDRFAYA